MKECLHCAEGKANIQHSMSWQIDTALLGMFLFLFVTQQNTFQNQ